MEKTRSRSLFGSHLLAGSLVNARSWVRASDRRARPCLVPVVSDPRDRPAWPDTKQWREPFPAYFTTGRANNGGAEAINGLIQLHRRVARGFHNRDNHRRRMLLIGGASDRPRLT